MSSTTRRWLAEVQVDGKQAWIFETNRLRDAVGASYLVAEVGQVAHDEAQRRGGAIILCASGLARVSFAEAATARAWVEAITARYALTAPGMEVVGAVVPLGDGPDALDRATQRAVEVELPKTRARLGGPALIDRGLPWLMPCDYSGLPAQDRKNPLKPEHRAGRRVSAGVGARRDVFGATRLRVRQQLEAAGLGIELVQRIDDAVLRPSYAPLDPDEDAPTTEPLSERDTWRAVIHMDANGLGRIFRRFGELAGRAKVRDEVAALQALSLTVNQAAWRALGLAIDDMVRQAGQERRAAGAFSVYPLVVGGDDITLATDGRWGLYLTRRLMERWIEEVRAEVTAQPNLGAILRAAATLWPADNLPTDHLPTCAGVAIVKHHFPFSLAYGLSDDLCRKAKAAVRGTPGSALDWHAVLDPTPPDLKEIRARLGVPDRTGVPANPGAARLTRRPYRREAFDELTRAASLLRAEGPDGRPTLPRAQLQELREGLIMGPAEAERRLGLVRARVGAPLDGLLRALHGEARLLPDGGTGLMDALDHLELMEGLLVPQAAAPAAGALGARAAGGAR